MKVKLEDVAREAGVSIATVSRVLNNRPVKEATRILVEQTIARLDYRPNLTARGLIKGTSNRIGVIVPSMENPYFSSVMHNIEERMRREGYLCNFSCVHSRGEEERKVIACQLDSGVDGVILVDVNSRHENMGLYGELNSRVPVVLINGNPERDDVNLVLVEQEKGVGQVLDYLFSLGHRKIAYLRGAGASHSFIIKEQAFRRKMSEAGIGEGEFCVIKAKDSDHFSSLKTVSEELLPLLRREDRPSAIFAANELMALGVLDAVRRLGLSVPEDLSLVGHDNTFLSRAAYPSLTTVDLFPSRLGAEAAEMMLRLLQQDRPFPPRRLMFNPELIVRRSCRAIEGAPTDLPGHSGVC